MWPFKTKYTVIPYVGRLSGGKHNRLTMENAERISFGIGNTVIREADFLQSPNSRMEKRGNTEPFAALLVDCIEYLFLRTIRE